MSIHLLNLVYPDSSCTRDKVSRAAGRRAVGSVFCSPFIKCTVTSKLRFHYRDSYVIGFYRDQTTCVRLPGLAKNSPTLTQTAPNYTTEPLGCMLAKPETGYIIEFIMTLKFCPFTGTFPFPKYCWTSPAWPSHMPAQAYFLHVYQDLNPSTAT